jgi:DNA-binding NarL/FixJ family response regulator
LSTYNRCRRLRRHAPADREGALVIDPALVQDLVSVQRREKPLAALPTCEQQVLTFMAEGRTNAGIAMWFGVTQGTVEEHVSSILPKMGPPETDDDHRRVRAVITFLDAQ